MLRSIRSSARRLPVYGLGTNQGIVPMMPPGLISAARFGPSTYATFVLRSSDHDASSNGTAPATTRMAARIARRAPFPRPRPPRSGRGGDESCDPPLPLGGGGVGGGGPSWLLASRPPSSHAPYAANSASSGVTWA